MFLLLFKLFSLILATQVRSLNFDDNSILPIITYHPDQDRTTCEIVQARGFPCQIHLVTTGEGYIVESHRIPAPFGSKVVILQNGLTGSSADFVFGTDLVDRDPRIIGHNLALELYKQGYDVWMLNNRGSRYGLMHKHLNTDQKQFWNFSFDQISRFDTPAFIHYIRNYTCQSKSNIYRI